MTRLVALLTATIILIAVAAALLIRSPGTGLSNEGKVGTSADSDRATDAPLTPARNTPNTGWLQEFAVGELNKLAPANPAAPLPIVTFENERGLQVGFDEFRGKILLINFWATWCAPCRHEMPALDALESAMGGPDFAVLALSIDRGGHDVAAKFYRETDIKSLPLYLDSGSRAARALNVYGLPVTILADRDGFEIARFVGPADWASADAQKLIRAAIERGQKPSS